MMEVSLCFGSVIGGSICFGVLVICGEGSLVVFSFCRDGSLERNQIVYGAIHGVINILFSRLYISVLSHRPRVLVGQEDIPLAK